MKIGVAKDVGVGAIVRAWTQVSAFLVIIVAGRVLDREDFGLYAIAAVFITVLSTIIYSGIYEYIIQIENVEDVADTCFWINMGIAVCGTLLMIAAAPVSSEIMRAPRLANVMLWLAPSTLIAALASWQEALVLRQRKISDYYYVWFIAETGAATLAIVLFFHDFRIGALIAYRYGQLLLTSVGYFALTRRLPRFQFAFDRARSALSFGHRLYASRLIGILTNYGADLIIGSLASPADAGAYRLSSRMIFGVSEIWLQPIKTIAWVRFSSALNARAGIGEEWLSLMILLSMIAWPALGGVAVLSTQVTETVLGATWLAAAPIVSILAFAKSFELFEVFLDPLLTLSGQSGRLLCIRLAALVVAMAGFFSLARFGAAHAAWAQAATYGLLAATTVALGARLTKTDTATIATKLWPGIATTLAVAGAAAATAHVTATSGWPVIVNLALDIASGASVWGIMIGLIFRERVMTAMHQLRQSGVRIEDA